MHSTNFTAASPFLDCRESRALNVRLRHPDFSFYDVRDKLNLVEILEQVKIACDAAVPPTDS